VAGFLRVFRFPLPSIPPTAPHPSSSIIIRGWYNRPIATSAIVDSVPLYPKKEGKKIAASKCISGYETMIATSFPNRQSNPYLI
jgi:hypothetical protein